MTSTNNSTYKRDGKIILTYAMRCIATCLKTIHAKNPTDEMTDLLNGFYAISKGVQSDNDILSDSYDILNVACTAIITEYEKISTVLSISSILNGGHDPHYVIYDGECIPCYYYTKRGTKEVVYSNFGQWFKRKIYSAIKQYIRNQSHSKGRKKVYDYETIQNAPIYTYDASGKLIDTKTFEPCKRATKSGYEIELVSFNSLDGNTPENYDKLSLSYEMHVEGSYSDAIAFMKSLLTPSECQVFSYLWQSYKQVDIAREMGKSVSTIKTLVQRIREKIAQSGFYSDNYAVAQYAQR